jgi:hypothetical protein
MGEYVAFVNPGWHLRPAKGTFSPLAVSFESIREQVTQKGLTDSNPPTEIPG